MSELDGRELWMLENHNSYIFFVLMENKSVLENASSGGALSVIGETVCCSDSGVIMSVERAPCKSWLTS